MADSSRIERLRQRVEIDPASIAFAQLAEEYRRAGQYGEAVAVCRAGLAIHPGYLSARVTLGRALLELGEFDVARSELEAVLQIAPENLAAIRAVAESYERSGASGEALTYYRAALEIARNDPEIEHCVERLARAVVEESERVARLAAEESARLARAVAEQLERAAREAAEESARLADDAAVELARLAREAAEGAAPLARDADESSTPLARDAEVVRCDDSQEPERAHAEQTIAALELWLDAIHGTRPC